MKEREQKIDMAENALEEVEIKRQELKGSIKKYKNDYLKEELEGIPRYYLTTEETATTPDEVMESLRKQGVQIENESQLDLPSVYSNPRTQQATSVEISSTLSASHARKCRQCQT